MPPSAFRRRLLTLSTFLTLGVAINIAIAWIAIATGSLNRMEGRGVRPPTARPDDPMSGWLAPVHIAWPWPVPADWPPLKRYMKSRSFGLLWEEGSDNDGIDLSATTHLTAGVRAGWPFKSLYWTRSNILENQIETWTTNPRGIKCPPSWGPLTNFGTLNGWVPRRLPLTPLWPAFIANSLLYSLTSAALILTPLAALHTLRRNKRRRAGNCTTCGYPLHGTTCPECGTTTTTHQTLTTTEAPTH